MTEFVPNAPGVYAILNLVTGDEYIGQSQNMAYRIYQHRGLLVKNEHPNRLLQDAWNEHGPHAFKVVILYEMPAQTRAAELSQLEAMAIRDRCPTYNHLRPYTHPALTNGKISLRQAREERNISAVRLAVDVGLTYSALMNLEMGRVSPRIETAERIYQRLDMPVGSIAWRWNKKQQAS